MKPLRGLDEISGCNLEAVAELGFQFRFKNLEFEIVKTPRDRRKKNSDVFGVLVVYTLGSYYYYG